MAARTRTNSQLQGDVEARAIAATLGAEVRRTRRARRLTQATLAARVGWRQARIGEIERGEGEPPRSEPGSASAWPSAALSR